MLISLSVSLALTLALEGILALLWGVKDRRDWKLLLIVNVVTNPIVVSLHHLLGGGIALTAALEIFAVVSEWLAYGGGAGTPARPFSSPCVPTAFPTSAACCSTIYSGGACCEVFATGAGCHRLPIPRRPHECRLAAPSGTAGHLRSAGCLHHPAEIRAGTAPYPERKKRGEQNMLFLPISADVISWPFYVMQGIAVLVPAALVVAVIVITVILIRRRRKK